MNALLLVDIQNDFFPGGALTVKGAEEIIPLLKEIVEYPFDLIVAVKDWHPYDHGSFATNHEGRQAGEQISLGGLSQILWPVHCVQGTWGAEFASGWDVSRVDKIFYKGTNPLVDSYSGFYDNGHRLATGLEIYLKDKGVKKIYILGVATDYCVKFSVLDALQLGFESLVVADACRGVNLNPDDSKNAFFQMRQAGASLLSVKDLQNLLENEKKGL